ncbi:LPS export ABC transporter ATP-binding protein [bacterium]|nr:LPS export ABC transporter ATP-binding protein [bacterium]
MNELLEAVGIEKKYHHKKVVDGVSIQIHKGEIVGLLGPNGAGKTTTFSLMLGLIPRDSGGIYLDGEDITEYPMYMRARKGLSLLPQEASAFNRLTVEDNLRAVKETMTERPSKRTRDIMETLRELGLEQLSKVKAYTLSGGERRRLEIARALILDPDYILLDEPFTGIDPLAILELQKIILSLKEEKIGLLLTDHSVKETLRITDRAYIIDKGKILKEGTPQQLVASEEVRKRYLGESFSYS